MHKIWKSVALAIPKIFRGM